MVHDMSVIGVVLIRLAPAKENVRQIHLTRGTDPEGQPAECATGELEEKMSPIGVPRGDEDRLVIIVEQDGGVGEGRT